MKKITLGILAHVDAGKTTLSEAILYNSGRLKELGRVDHQDAFLDTDSLEKQRGITIFSKPAIFEYGGVEYTLLDTPGHVDFATELERALWVMDYCILLINGADGVQAHTKTIFRLLQNYQVPVLIFVNKLDQPGVEPDRVMAGIKSQLSDCCGRWEDLETAATNDEAAMEEYLDTGSLQSETKRRLFAERKWMPVFAGSALRNQGVRELMDALTELNPELTPGNEFGARVYKIESLGQDTRLSFAKITGGSLAVKDLLPTGEKVDQLRRYSGSKYEQVQTAEAGDVVALVGPQATYAGQGLGCESDRREPYLAPVLEYALIFNEDLNVRQAYPKLQKLSEEDPSLHVKWDEKTEQIKLQLMGQVQTEIIKERIKLCLGYDVSFEEGSILYKETIVDTVEGVGHFEPLRHYAEVHLLMEPLEPGRGIVVEADLPVDVLSLNWQRLIATHIMEREQPGVLTGAPLTDVKITVAGGRAHLKHTEGGDFREATYRAIRQGLMEAECQLLEPYLNFELTIPEGQIGRAMNDIEAMQGSFESPVTREGMAVITGCAPAVTIRNYQAEVVAYTKGLGILNLDFAGYRPCHNQEEVLSLSTYDPEADLDNPAGSIFCFHGAGTYVPWDQVKPMCHVPCVLSSLNDDIDSEFDFSTKREQRSMSQWLTPDEIDQILRQATHNNGGKNSKKGWNYGESHVRRSDSDYVYTAPKEVKPRVKYMLVDGYNLIYAWPELKAVLDVNLDGARGRLLDILSNYKAMTDYEVIAVFDAYKVKGHAVSVEDYQNIHQVFTAEAQTADAYIEKFTHEHGKKYDITVVTSDGLEQVIIRGAGARLISSREFIVEVDRAARELRERYQFTSED